MNGGNDEWCSNDDDENEPISSSSLSSSSSSSFFTKEALDNFKSQQCDYSQWRVQLGIEYHQENLINLLRTNQAQQPNDASSKKTIDYSHTLL